MAVRNRAPADVLLLLDQVVLCHRPWPTEHAIPVCVLSSFSPLSPQAHLEADQST